jgi:hypothetical protein
MGKREALLIAAFIIAGVVVYQLTAAPREGGGGFSLSGLIDEIRSDMRSHSATAEVTTDTTHTLPPETRELGVSGVPQIEIVGEDRKDVAASLTVSSTGSSQTEAESLARRTTVELRSAADVTKLGIDYPVEGRQRVLRLALKVPSGLRIRLEATTGRVGVQSVPELHLFATRGTLNVRSVGLVKGDHRGGTIEIAQADEVRLTGNGIRLRLDQVGSLSLELTGGDVRATGAGGPIEINARNTDIDLAAPEGSVRIGASGGEVRVTDLRHALRLDGRDTEVSIQLARPAPVTAFTSSAPIELIVPSGQGFTLDAVAAEGRIEVPDDVVTVTGDDAERRAAGTIHGGGPTISLRTTRGTITIRK